MLWVVHPVGIRCRISATRASACDRLGSLNPRGRCRVSAGFFDSSVVHSTEPDGSATLIEGAVMSAHLKQGLGLPVGPAHLGALLGSAAAAIIACSPDPEPLGPDLAKGGGGAQLTATPGTLTFNFPLGATPATVTARVQFVGLITA